MKKLFITLMKWCYLIFGKLLHKAGVKLSVLSSIWKSFSLKSVGKKCMLNRYVEISGGKNISMGDFVSIGKYSCISAWDYHRGISYKPEINIGSHVSIGAFAHISAANRIDIGNNVLMGKHVTIVDNAHGKSVRGQLSVPPKRRPLFCKGPVVIEDNVWIGDKATILSNVTIGTGAIVAANSVVVNNVPAGTVVGGVPAKVLKLM
jgi:Acetyltransferase (isoleucine patch superfamily)